MRISKHNRIPLVLAAFCVLIFAPSFSFAQSSSSGKRTAAMRQSVAWDPEGQNFESYDQFKDDLIFSMRTAIKRIIVVSQYLSDNDITAALYSARARGIKVTILLDRYTNTGSRARARPRFPHVVYANLDAIEMEGDSTVVIDRSVWRLNVALDVNVEEGVRIDRSPYTAPEVESWIKQGQVNKMPESKPSDGANPSTSGTQPKLRIFGNIKKPNEPSPGAVPRTLPRETKWQKLNRGVDTELLHGDAPNANAQPSAVPTASSRESDLSE